MNNNALRVISILLLIAILCTACSGLGGGMRSGAGMHHDIYYRNPWHGYGHFPPPVYIGPPPVIEIPDIEFEAVPLPM